MQDVCLSSKLLSPTCVTLKISINIMDYITNATVLIQKQRPTTKRDKLVHNGGKVSDSTVSQIATIMYIYLTNFSYISNY